ncbi:MAG TPA: hypothetical protein VII38_03475 [Polyangia bacterium]|jgi:hypothetical protein
MVRSSLIIIGLFLLAVWISGLALHAAAWITWLDFVVAILALGMGAAPIREAGPLGAGGGPVLLSLGLFAMWIVALAIHIEPWIAWCTFAGACAMLIVGAVGGSLTTHYHRTLRPA